jgi:hypothetical protein
MNRRLRVRSATAGQGGGLNRQEIAMRPTPFRIAALGGAFVAVMGAALVAAAPAAAQTYDRYDRHDRYDRYDRHDRRRDRDDDRTEDVLIGAAVGAVAGAIIGDGDGRYVAGGALAGAALGASASSDHRDYRGRPYYGGSRYSYGYGYDSYRRSDCGYWRDGRCWRNQGHWEREHGINSRDGYDRWERRQYRQSDRRERRYYRHDRRW